MELFIASDDVCFYLWDRPSCWLQMAHPRDPSERDVSCPIPWSSQHRESLTGELETLLKVSVKEDMHQVKTLSTGK